MCKLRILNISLFYVFICGVSFADDFTISTYYPAPYGRYREFSTTGKTTLATDEFGNEGPNAVVGIGTTNPFRMFTLAQDGDGVHLGFDRTDRRRMTMLWDQTALPARPNQLTFFDDADGGTTPFSFDFANDSFYVEDGNVGVGTVTPNSTKGTNGYIDAQDVYLRDVGRWASEGGSGGYDFGGLYGKHENGSCVYTNPFTGGCDCPPGYSVQQVLSPALYGKPASELFMCYRL